MPSSTFSRRLLILANAPSAPQISLHSRSGHISPSVAIFLARFRFSQDFLNLHFGDCSSSPDSSKQRLNGFCATSGTVLPPPQRGNRVRPSIGPGTRLFQPLFPCAKEGRRFTTHSRSASSEPLPLQRDVQNVDAEDYYVSDSSGRLICLCRPERCLFPHSGCPAAQESSFGLLLEGRLINTKFFPLAWLWHRGRSRNAWMLPWPRSGSRAFVYSITWTIGSFWPTPESQ